MKSKAFIVIATAGILIAAVVFVSNNVMACGCDQGTGCSDDAMVMDGMQNEQTVASPTAAPLSFDKAPAVGTKAKCPVTGDELTVTKETKSSVYKGKYYVFCCPGCKPQFDANPEKYLK